MNKQIEYRSVFAPYFYRFLRMKEVMGYGLAKFEWILLEFDRFFLEAGATNSYITGEQIAAWRQSRVNDKERTLYDKYSVMSQFCKYMCHLGHECYIPRLPKQKDWDFIPYVFTHEQMENIFRECDRLVLVSANMNTALIAIPALIRFLYSTGVRIGEALSIKNGDVDYSRNRIIIRKTKNRLQRIIPINTSLENVMKQYEQYRNRMPVEGLTNNERFFFISAIGKPIAKCTVLDWFKKVASHIGMPHIGKNQWVRIHDIRHTCAVHALQKMIHDGIDMYCALPILSVFLGHKSIKGTEKYVRMVQEIYPDIIGMENAITSFVFPVKLEIDDDYGNKY